MAAAQKSQKTLSLTSTQQLSASTRPRAMRFQEWLLRIPMLEHEVKIATITPLLISAILDLPVLLAIQGPLEASSCMNWDSTRMLYELETRTLSELGFPE